MQGRGNLTYHYLYLKMQEDKLSYLESIHVSPNEVHKGWGEEYFIFDGTRVWMPEHFTNVKKYKKYLEEFSTGLPPSLID